MQKSMICFTAAGGAAGRRIIFMKIINAKVFTGHSFTDGGIEFDQKNLPGFGVIAGPLFL